MRGFVDAGHVSFEDSSVKELVSEPLRNGKSVKDGIGSKVLRLSALKSGIIDIRESKLGDWSGIKVAPYLVRSGDFLVSRGNGSKDLVGRGGEVGSIREEIAFPDTMIRIRPDPSIMQLQYFAIAWHSRSVRAQIESIAKTTAGIWKISQADLGEIRLPVPTPEEQTEIVRRVEQLFAFADQLEARVAAAQERIDKLTQSILAKAFRGELVPQDPNDEPASVLLERIKAQRAAAPKTKRGRKAKA
jgi:type I restriction enzyme S subunit